MLSGLISIINSIVESCGYIGIAIAMALESTVFPLPSELVMIPAGYLSSKGIMSFPIIVLAGTAGCVVGSYIMYLFAQMVGKEWIVKHAKWFLLSPSKLELMENFFLKHGEISVFIARLIPVVRHFIGIPAGLFKMNVKKFLLFTALGSFIWMTCLTFIGYSIGVDLLGVKMMLIKFKIGIVIFASSTVLLYMLLKKKLMKAIC